MLLDLYGEALTTKQRDYLYFYYNDDLSLSEIAESFSISRQGVRSVLKKGENLLVDMENKLQLASRFIKMRDKSSEIASELENINNNINNGEISSKIHSLIEQIKEMANY